MMTETQALEPKVKNAYSSILPNRTLGKLVLNAMEELYPVHFSSDEIIYAAEFSEIVHGTCQTYNDSYDAEPNGVLSATTDFGDVSWVVPSVAFASTCYVNGTAMHSWDLTAQGKASGAHRGMHTAAKVMFSCLNELYTNPGLLESARKDFEAALDGQTYQTMLPEQIHPPKLP